MAYISKVHFHTGSDQFTDVKDVAALLKSQPELEAIGLIRAECVALGMILGTEGYLVSPNHAVMETSFVDESAYQQFTDQASDARAAAMVWYNGRGWVVFPDTEPA